MGSMTSGRVDSSDVYRAALTQAVASLDAYIHGIVLDRAVDIMLGRLPPGPAHRTIGLPFHAVHDVLVASSPGDAELAARTHVAERLSKSTFQSPSQVEEALAMVGVRSVWTTAFGASAAAVKLDLGLVVARRNRIVHSCDADPANPGSAMSFPDVDAASAIQVVDRLVSGIDPLC